MLKIPVEKLFLLFLFLYLILHLSIMHYNQHQISKLDIKGKKQYAIMTFITVYFIYFIVLPSFMVPSKQKVKLLTSVVGFVLVITYIFLTLNFLSNTTNRKVLKEGDKQTRLCYTNMFLTIIGYVIVVCFGMTKSGWLRGPKLTEISREIITKSYEEAKSPEDRKAYYKADLDFWYESLIDPKFEDWKSLKDYLLFFRLSSKNFEKENLMDTFFEVLTPEKLTAAKEILSSKCNPPCDERIIELDAIIRLFDNYRQLSQK